MRLWLRVLLRLPHVFKNVFDRLELIEDVLAANEEELQQLRASMAEFVTGVPDRVK